METIESVQEQVTAAVGAITEFEQSAVSTLLSVGDSIFDLRVAVADAAAKEQEFARTGGINDRKAALRSLRQLLWRVRMLDEAARTVRAVVDGIAEDYEKAVQS